MLIHATLSSVLHALSLTIDRVWDEYVAIILALLIPKITDHNFSQRTFYVLAATLLVLIINDVVRHVFDVSAQPKPITTPAKPLPVAPVKQQSAELFS